MSVAAFCWASPNSSVRSADGTRTQPAARCLVSAPTVWLTEDGCASSGHSVARFRLQNHSSGSLLGAGSHTLSGLELDGWLLEVTSDTILEKTRIRVHGVQGEVAEGHVIVLCS